MGGRRDYQGPSRLAHIHNTQKLPFSYLSPYHRLINTTPNTQNLRYYFPSPPHHCFIHTNDNQYSYHHLSTMASIPSLTLKTLPTLLYHFTSRFMLANGP
ncbi:hypothetical protein E2C01_054052 [Portunus trituberculatus]|uniref:Uncharacterized protein n=1 Tax=Portunus trituberculatus TaxID=210409 RepID=A0A5B7GS48_PORTR|nr:hypothetical protein [Portunus trituberculatus]